MQHALHFVGFRGDEFTSAVRVFGKPDFFHRFWDVRAQQEVQDGDIVVFASCKEWSRIAEPKLQAFDDSSIM